MSDFNNGLSVAGTASFTGEIHAPGGSAVATNEAQGTGALAANTSGGSNTAQGAYALTTNNIGSNNTAHGYTAMQFNTSGAGNSAHGTSSLRYNTSGNYNTAQGDASLYSNTTGTKNTAAGYHALYSNISGQTNSAYGQYSLNSLTTGSNNAAIGYQSLYSSVLTNYSCAHGTNSLYYNVTGNYNSGFGAQTLYELGSAITAGAFVVGISYTILVPGTTDFTLIGAANSTAGTTFTATGVGSGTGTATPNANNNTAVGYNTGRGIVHGSNNTIIGANVTGLAAGLANNIIIADGAGNQRIKVDSSGNMGLGVTPSAWGSGRVAFDAGANVYFGGIGQTEVIANGYYNGTNFIYKSTAYSTRYNQNNGIHSWHTAPSGTAGNVITYTQAMTLDASGNLGLGVTPKTWNTSFKAIDLGSYGSSFSARTDAIESSITSNSYRSAASGWVYATTGVAARYTQSAGAHYLYGAPSGTADAAITFTQLLAVSKDNSLALQGATSQTGIGVSFPATEVTSSDPNTLTDFSKYNAASAACSGAITTSSAWKLTKIGNQVTLTLPVVTGTATATTSFAFGTAIPAKYRPSTSLVFNYIVRDNATNSTAGMLGIDASNGTITVYKNAALGAFTASADAGIPYSAAVSWTI